MKNEIISGFLYSIISGILIIVIDHFFIPDEEEIVIGFFVLFVIIFFLSLFFSVLFNVFLYRNNDEHRIFSDRPSLSVILSFNLVFLSIFIYRIYPAYFYMKITDGVINEIIKLENRKKEYGISIVNKEKMFEMFDDLFLDSWKAMGAINFTKESMKEHPVLSLIAYLHPSAETYPVMLKNYAVSRIEIDYRDDGIYLSGKRDTIKIASKLRLKIKEKEYKLFLSTSDAYDIYRKKYGKKDDFIITCPALDDFLLFSEDGCRPVTDKVMLKFIAKPKDTLWHLYTTKDEYTTLVSPDKYRRIQDPIMGGIFDMLRSSTKVVNEKNFILVFSNDDSKIKLDAVTSFKVYGNENWITIDDKEVLVPNSINNKYFEKFYSMQFEHMSKMDLDQIMSAEYLSFKVRVSESGSYIKHKIPLNKFKTAFSKLLQMEKNTDNHDDINEN